MPRKHLPAELMANLLPDCEAAQNYAATKKGALDEDEYRALIADQFDVDTPKKLYNFLCKFQKFDEDLSEQTEVALDVYGVYVEFFEEFAWQMIRDETYSRRVYDFLQRNEFDVRVYRGRIDYRAPRLRNRDYFFNWSSRGMRLHEHIKSKLKEWWDPNGPKAMAVTDDRMRYITS